MRRTIKKVGVVTTLAGLYGAVKNLPLEDIVLVLSVAAFFISLSQSLKRDDKTDDETVELSIPVKEIDRGLVIEHVRNAA